MYGPVMVLTTQTPNLGKYEGGKYEGHTLNTHFFSNARVDDESNPDKIVVHYLDKGGNRWETRFKRRAVWDWFYVDPEDVAKHTSTEE